MWVSMFNFGPGLHQCIPRDSVEVAMMRNDVAICPDEALVATFWT